MWCWAQTESVIGENANVEVIAGPTHQLEEVVVEGNTDTTANTSSPSTPRGIGRIAMDSDLPESAIIERLRACSRLCCKSEDFLEEKYLQKLNDFGYEFGHILGSGHYGTVIECFFTDVVGGARKPLACKKVIIPSHYETHEDKEDFVKNRLNPEKLALTVARHKNIIGIQNIWSNYESFYNDIPLFVLFFMERADGDLFGYAVNNLTTRHCPLEEEEVKLWFKMILSGLEYLHSINIAHLDLKTENILYVRNWQLDFPYVAKITDFGLSYISKGHESVHLYHGSIGYMAPEVRLCKTRRRIRYDPFKADIYSLGRLLVFMVCFFHFEVLVDGKKQLPTRQKHVYISEELDNLVSKLFKNNPNERPSIEQIKNDSWLLSSHPDLHAFGSGQTSRGLKPFSTL
jgi:serine/threonine protein kinase